jgi:hypothetical protein
MSGPQLFTIGFAMVGAAVASIPGGVVRAVAHS